MDRKRVLIVQNDEIESLGLYADYLDEEAFEHEVFHAYRLEPQEPFPAVEDYDAFIMGPTPISANQYHRHGFLLKEWDFIAEVTRSRKPCLGVCCGAQLLAK